MASKRKLQKLARMGLAGGILIVGGTLAINSYVNDSKSSNTSSTNDIIALNFEAIAQKKYIDPFASLDDKDGNIGYHLMTETELKLQLNQEGWDLYQSLDDEGKRLALKVASQSCNNTNYCKGLNACQTEKNACAGQGDCRNQGKCAFSDKNLAIKVIAKKMAEKRAEAAKKLKKQ